MRYATAMPFVLACTLLAATVFAADRPPVKRFYAPDSFWNQSVPADAAIDARSASIVAAALVPFAAYAAFSNGNDWGVSVINASAPDKTYSITCRLYFCTGPVTFPIPKGALPTTGDDHHLVVIDGTRELDMWDASYDARSDTWSAGSRFIGDLYGWGANAAPGQRAGGSFAAGFSGMGGVVRPEEMAQGHIDHALSLMIPKPRAGYVPPATMGDGKSSGPDAIPEGAHIQLDPSFDVDAQPWPAWEKIVARALQTYGAYVSDTGGALAFYGQTDMNAGNLQWRAIGVPKNASLSNLPWSRMRVLKQGAVMGDGVPAR